MHDKAQRRAWTIDRIAYATLAFLGVAQWTRLEKLFEAVGEQGLGIQALTTWARTVGHLIEYPFLQ